MRKILIFSMCALSFLSIKSCSITNGGSESSSQSSSSAIVSEFSSLSITNSDFFNKYKSLTSVSYEESFYVNDALYATRKNYVDLNSNYYYSVISYDSNDKYLTYSNDKIIKISGGVGKETNLKLDSVWSPSGLDFIFENSADYSYRNGAYFGVFSSFYDESLFTSIEEIANKIYVETQGIMMLNVEGTDTDITKITLNLSNCYSSVNSSTTLEITNISFDAFDYITPEYESGSSKFTYLTSDTLDLFSMEMHYQYGDSTLIKSGEFEMLIDAGQKEDGPYVSKMLKEYCTDGHLEVLIVTHGHGDHTGGFGNTALSSIKNIDLIIDYGYQDTDYYQTIKQKYIANGTEYHSAYDCVNAIDGASDKYQFSRDLSMEILDTNQYAKTGEIIPGDANENDYSVSTLITFKQNTYLLTGDLAGNENPLKGKVGEVTVYKGAHHGARTYNSNSSTLLNMINPKIVFVSAAINQTADYDAYTQPHPTNEFVDKVFKTKYISSTKNLYFNGTMGTIHFVDDGINLPVVTGLGATVGYNNKSTGNKVTGEDNLRYCDTVLFKYRHNY